MSYNWGPHYIVPSEVLKKYSGNVVLREELDDWYTALEDDLDRCGSSISGSEFIEILVTSLIERFDLTRLMSLEMVVLEQNVDAMASFHFQRWRRDRMVTIGTTMERVVEGFEEGAGVQFLHRAQLLTSALSPAANPRGAATYEIGDPDFEFMSVDFESELRRLLNGYFENQATN